MTGHFQLKPLFFLTLLLPFAQPATADEIDFGRDVRPILSAKCFFCHGPDEEHRKAKLRLDTEDGATGEHNGIRAIVAGDLDASEAWHRIISDDPDELMPPPEVKKPLTSAEKDILRKWIEAGAPWSDHWAFVAPEKPAVPKPATLPADATNPIDAFIHETLADKKLAPSPPADARTLIRRITFDLTGPSTHHRRHPHLRRGIRPRPRRRRQGLRKSHRPPPRLPPLRRTHGPHVA